MMADSQYVGRVGSTCLAQAKIPPEAFDLGNPGVFEHTVCLGAAPTHFAMHDNLLWWDRLLFDSFYSVCLAPYGSGQRNSTITT
jgi:hypothetical protein